MAKSKYFNRELSWIEFNQRVLGEAIDPAVPLLERVKFLAITSSNLDEFFMVRVGSLKLLQARGSRKKDPAGMTAAAQLRAIAERTHDMVQEQYACYRDSVEPQLREAGIVRLGPRDLNEVQEEHTRTFFESEVFPVMTPMWVEHSPAATFPLLTNQSLYLAVRLRKANSRSRANQYALLPIGRSTTRFVTLPAESGYTYILIEDLVREHVARFFDGYQVLETVPFRISRNADIALQDDLAADLMMGMEEILSERKRSDCVRLEVEASISQTLLNFLSKALGVRTADTYLLDGPLDFRPFMEIGGLSGFEHLQNEEWPPVASADVDPSTSMFNVISKRDVLLYHPYEDFEPVVRLVEEAAEDPDVVAIKQILYRTSSKSPIVKALRRAAERGKYVTALVELKARFDEARNIEWARSLEESGVQVIYGVKGLKTHAKICIVVRREPYGLQRYVHYGTGNYNESTARLYTDVSLMTCDDNFGRDASAFFNMISGHSQPVPFAKIYSAPIGLRERIIELIDYEAQRKKGKQKAVIRAKVNSLYHPDVIDALYRASQAGVKIDLNVRGICGLRPGVKGLSENIRVTSIIDRYLEHARVMYFYHGGEELVYISSADWMSRNLDKRVELMVPVEDERCRKRLIDALDTHFSDRRKAWELQADGSYTRLRAKGKSKGLQSQRELSRVAAKRRAQVRDTRPTVFEPHRSVDPTN